MMVFTYLIISWEYVKSGAKKFSDSDVFWLLQFSDLNFAVNLSSFHDVVFPWLILMRE